MGRHFSKEDIQRAQRQMKRCSASLAIREMQIKTTMRYHITTTRITIIKTSNPIKKWAKDLNRHFSKEDIQRAQRQMKRCSASLAIRDMEIETTMRYHFTAVRMDIITKSTND